MSWGYCEGRSKDRLANNSPARPATSRWARLTGTSSVRFSRADWSDSAGPPRRLLQHCRVMAPALTHGQSSSGQPGDRPLFRV